MLRSVTSLSSVALVRPDGVILCAQRRYTTRYTSYLRTMSLLTRIIQFAATCNLGDEIALSSNASVEQGRGLLLGYGSTGFYLRDDQHVADLGTSDLEVVAAAACDWAASTGASLIEQRLYDRP